MNVVEAFLSPASPSLKICGVTSPTDAQGLIDKKVPAIGINFWPKSKRYCSPDEALEFLPALRGQIARVGVFVNNARQLAPDLLAAKAIDLVQLHGDEDDEELIGLLAQDVPVIRALSLQSSDHLPSVVGHYENLLASHPGTLALLLDAHAPGVYGGTGETIDWEQAGEFIRLASPLPVLLAGGIVPENAAKALRLTRPAGLDVASGAESSPGVKDFEKVSQLLVATQTANPLP
ncbi:phosphoribosylanthranilate isomerase [Roseibacillus persicicus]|uniref:N-(5'-phosphoribosyl)anthranilate isomerase n=1 Tax=Roseibacillus persicicus TaxID=454148 RepID=A0A918WK21_9BACT|nr:phosphoribosylanthranilate isomerase [Roseibacillus persicicus]GHC50051.1 N-(5'-phosphoribosyl)anthranilate isomerase [Roseibacillus persicicus]